MMILFSGQQWYQLLQNCFMVSKYVLILISNATFVAQKKTVLSLKVLSFNKPQLQIFFILI